MGGLITSQLTLALRKHAQTARQFVNVFARDELPLIIGEIPAIIIAILTLLLNQEVIGHYFALIIMEM